MNENTYDARVRASYKRLVRELGILTWREVVAMESKLAAQRGELMRVLRDCDADPTGVHGKGRFVKVSHTGVGILLLARSGLFVKAQSVPRRAT